MKRRVTPGTVEQRSIVVDDIETRAANESGAFGFKGHAAVFNRFANIGGFFKERIAPGAFTKTIQEADVRFLMNHDPQYVLARSKAGTLRLSEDKRGLLVDADMAPTTYASDLSLLLERGDVSQMSFGFIAVRDEWDESKKIPERTVTEAKLFDVSVVTFPAYDGTDAALRSAQLSALLDMLGLDELPEEQRNTLLLQVHSGDVAPEYVPILRAAQERFSSLAVRADEESPDSDPEVPFDDTPAGERSINIETMRRRHKLIAMRHSFAL